MPGDQRSVRVLMHDPELIPRLHWYLRWLVWKGWGGRLDFTSDVLWFTPDLPWLVRAGRRRVVAWDDATDPRARPEAFRALITFGEPLLATEMDRLAWLWYRPRVEGIPAERWALRATGTVELSPGEYRVQTISDDGIRVWVDGQLAIDAWDPHESRVDAAMIPGGRHDLVVEYYQVDGWVELSVDIQPVRPR